ncbi:MAG: carbohydrate kinase family protein [Gaiellaceae bacterium]
MQVACVGLATRDTIWRLPSHPPPDGRVVATEVVVAGGGPAGTAAVTLARLGIDVAFAGAVGDDDAGDFVRAGLASEGVDITQLAVVPAARTPQSAILVGPEGTRSIVHHPGDAPFPDVAAHADWVHVDHVGYAHAQGRVSVDAGNPIDGLDLRGVALYAPTEERLRADFGDAQTALDAGAELVVVTRGAEGSVATTREGEVIAPGVPCDPVSTLGAGDVFHGALLAYLVRGAPLAEALHAANAAAALSCRALDGRSAIPTLDELQRSLIA